MVHIDFPKVKTILNEERQGYGFSNNRAFEISQGQYVLVLNEDMLVLPGAIDTMLEMMENDPSIGALGCRLLNGDKSLQHSCSYFPTLFNEMFSNLIPYHLLFPNSRFRSHMYHWDHTEDREVDVIKGCCMMIPRDFIEKHGLFDEQFFLFSDEYDLCKRIKKSGLKVFFTPNAEIIHYGRVTVDRLNTESHLIFLQSLIKYYKKHHGLLYSYTVKFVHLIGNTIRFFGWSVIWILKPSKRFQAKEKLRRVSGFYRWAFN
jgi:GT2 family glycosyltransferase